MFSQLKFLVCFAVFGSGVVAYGESADVNYQSKLLNDYVNNSVMQGIPSVAGYACNDGVYSLEEAAARKIEKNKCTAFGTVTLDAKDAVANDRGSVDFVKTEDWRVGDCIVRNQTIRVWSDGMIQYWSRFSDRGTWYGDYFSMTIRGKGSRGEIISDGTRPWEAGRHVNKMVALDFYADKVVMWPQTYFNSFTGLNLTFECTPQM